jgi:hypothetical protein
LNNAGLAVIRTVWFAGLCLGGLAAVVAVKAGTSTPLPIVGAPAAQTTVAETFSRDTLTEADKLEIAYVRESVAVASIMPATMASDEIRPPRPGPTATPKIVRKIASRDQPGPRARKPAIVSPDHRIKIREAKAKKSGNVERAKVTLDVKPCRRPEAVAGLLRILNLSPGCDS